MSRVAEKSLKALESAGLFEPKSRAAKLRHALPGIEKALSEGASIESCREAMKTVGMVFPSLNAFHVALHRARQSMPPIGSPLQATVAVVPDSTSVTDGVSPPVPVIGKETAPVSEKNGVPIFRPKRVEHGTNRTPTMKDFV